MTELRLSGLQSSIYAIYSISHIYKIYKLCFINIHSPKENSESLLAMNILLSKKQIKPESGKWYGARKHDVI